MGDDHGEDGDEVDVTAIAERSPGQDPDDPYADVDVSELPDWWRRAVREFDEYGLRPYRPPRFADDALTRPLIERLERELGVEVELQSPPDRPQGEWVVLVDGSREAGVTRRRSPMGFSVFEVSADAFEGIVRDAVERD